MISLRVFLFNSLSSIKKKNQGSNRVFYLFIYLFCSNAIVMNPLEASCSENPSATLTKRDQT